MVFGALRSIIRPVTRSLSSSSSSTRPASPFSSISHSPLSKFRLLSSPWITPSSSSSAFHSLTDTRFPKRRPSDKPRRKRASLKPPGPYAWVKYVPGEPIQANAPNVGSVKRRNEKKRIKQRKTFIMSEKKKRKAQLQEAKKKKLAKRVERKMATVARDRAWAEKLQELQRLEEEKKATIA